ncbi:hypothetical protein [Thermodesulfovibrio hydrogeniphilus]
MKKLIFSLLIVFSIATPIYASKEVPFTLDDRDRLIRLEAKLYEIDKRFEQIDKRFEQIDKRFDDLKTFLWIITGIFTTIMLGNIGFAYWDRRTIIRKAKEEAIEEFEKSGKLKDLINALRELAKTNAEVAKVLKQFNLL